MTTSGVGFGHLLKCTEGKVEPVHGVLGEIPDVEPVVFLHLSQGR